MIIKILIQGTRVTSRMRWSANPYKELRLVISNLCGANLSVYTSIILWRDNFTLCKGSKILLSFFIQHRRSNNILKKARKAIDAAGAMIVHGNGESLLKWDHWGDQKYYWGYILQEQWLNYAVLRPIHTICDSYCHLHVLEHVLELTFK